MMDQRTALGEAQGRRARGAVGVLFLTNGMALGLWSALIPGVKQGLALSDGRLGIALLAMAIGALVAMPLTGVLVARFGSAMVGRCAALVFFAVLPLPVIAPSLPLLVAALIVLGGANGVLDVAMNAHGVLVEGRLGRPVMSSFHGMFSLGGLIGAGVGGGLLVWAGGPALALGLACVAALAVLAGWGRLLPASADIGSHAGAGFALPRRGTLVLGLLAFAVLMSEGAMLDWSAVHLRESLGAGAALGGAGYAAFSAAMAVGRFSGDALRRRLGSVVLTRGGGVIAAVGLGAGLMVGTPGAMIAGFACAGIGFANMVPVLFGAAGRVPGAAPATSITAVATLGYAGFLVGPPLIGAVAEATRLGQALGLAVLAGLLVALAAGVTRVADGHGKGA
ncbi:Major facilitator superfamily MFS_1 [Rhodospirillum rubrum ATCC 11170]|uniref:Major facilitator superfamily MFS_1 n=1 Tax=Rhodospirillum rubrum (strain ATCC 11170 / ATH 1.1.1 / DSM 467 / LMG 4362 / NCIMB 8255 / S1) TaxID=269796 RepID=Q2RV64_RHORT|nr:MFS transporter [Rhodospirillum rubrum]ABC21981.1 Major facilitator superfamily MFS_1 [Rhodospirillum rubrum ATCC 11170]MBK5953552.1 MFS transporter [Rhodospirillum rubrum]QXG81638.1 MFS transporter [Rhodospirillum rubrum]